MLVTLFGILILVRASHLENADSPIFVTLFGMLMLASDSACVFASLLLSIIYILNGRKVIAWIL